MGDTCKSTRIARPTRTSTIKCRGELWGDSFIDTLVVAAGWVLLSPVSRAMASLPQPTSLSMMRCSTCV
eukprot:1156894-Pelagomonas_calceolata.AAC.14